MAERITLKWGTLKAWRVERPETKAALKRYGEAGPQSLSAACQHDTAAQKEALCDVIDALTDEDVAAGGLYLDWDAKSVSREEAKDYVRNYGKA